MSTSKTKVALVTGSSKGIGRALAIRLAKDGYHSIVTYFSDKSGGEKTVTDIITNGGAATLYYLDVTVQESVEVLLSNIEEKFGYLNVLVNNAVKDFPKPIEKTTIEEWKQILSTKLDGAFLMTKFAIPLLKKADNANLLIITSYEGEKPNPDYLAYGIATAGLIAFTKAMAVCLPNYGIRVNAISPGEIRTSLWKDIGLDDDLLWESLANQSLMKRVATVEDVADSAMLLINDPNRILNGNFLYVNGGNHLK